MDNRHDIQHIHYAPKAEEKKAPKPTPVAEVIFQILMIVAGLYFGIPLLALLARLAAEFWTPYPYRSHW